MTPEIELVADSCRRIEAPGFHSIDVKVKLEEESDCVKKKTRPRRGRPPRTVGKASPISRKKREDEDVCFVCFDGGSLVLCDRRGCPKVYHPACVKRTEAFFKSRSKWNCGWHICTACQKDSFYMCYTCPYSVCKRCVRSSEYVLVRENKGFCGICMKTILLIENAAEEVNKEKVDFDDQGSWEYLFKIYWVSLKEKLSLSLDDLTKARNPWKSSASKRSRLHENEDGSSQAASRAKVRKIESLPALSNAAWATDELLDFVRFMKNGDITVLSKYDVQTLVLEYVRRNNLQKESSEIIMCDDRLMRLYGGKERVGHSEMLKLLDSHFLDQERSPVTDTSAGGVVTEEGENMNRASSRNYAVVKSETCAAALSNKPIDDLDMDMVWLYGDPDGKIHGPFSLMNLRQWNASGYFPPELRIWRLGEQQSSSILLTDALNGQFHSIPRQEEETTGKDQNKNVGVARLETRVLDFSPNSVSTDQSVITRNSDASHNKSHLDKTKVESPLPGQSPISCCSLSLSTFPGNSNTNCSLPLQETWNDNVQTEEAVVMNACNQSLTGAAEKQVTVTVQSCGQNWNAATPSSASNAALDSNSGLVCFTDNQEIDFLDLFSPTFKFNFASDTTDWQPIVTGPDECDESVSDLLAEVEAMESQKRLSSPTSTFRGTEELLQHSINDSSFSPAEGHSPALEASKGDSMSSTNDLQMHLRTNNVVDFLPWRGV